jgi:hypothetical protein
MTHACRFCAVLVAAMAIFCSAAGAFETTEQGKARIEADWLFQADGNPTRIAVQNEIKYTRDLIKRLSAMENAPNLTEETKKLDALEAAAGSGDVQAHYLAVRTLKRTIFFKNPLINFDRILLIDNPYPKGKQGDATDEWGHEARHRNGFMAVDGGRLITVGLHPGSEVKSLLPELTGSYWRPDLSFDGKEILISYRPAGEKSFHLYRCNADGSNLRQLTFGDYDDLDPVFAPDGKIIFCSSRQHSYVRCMPMTHSFAVSRCDGDGANIYVISANGEPEYLPSILNDGRVIFTRWEYTDKALWRVQSLWTCNPDGTNTQIFWGNQSVWPDVLTEARSIPGTNKIMFTGLGHHAWFDGSIGIIDPAKGLDYPFGLSRVTRDVAWPEVGNGPEDPEPVADYHASGKFYAYKTPYPLSEEYFLVSAREGNRLYNGSDNNWLFRLYLMDIYGNKELVFSGNHNAYHAMPFKAREMPPALIDRVQWPKIGGNEKPALGTLYSSNVFADAPEILKEKGKAIRIIQMDPKTYTTWHKIVQHDGPAVSVTQAEGVKRILGTTPIESDGSVAFQVPPGEAIFFEMLDAEGRAIHVMRSFTNVMPGEVRGCFGCHESQLGTPVATTVGIAMTKGAKPPVPPSWGVNESVSYARFAQPLFDKHCADCHQNIEHEAFAKLDLTFRPSGHRWGGWVYSQSDISPFTEPYLTLSSGPTAWGREKPRDERNVPKNLAGIFVVEGYNEMDPANLKTLPPYSAYSPVSPIVNNAMSGEHHGVKVTGEDLERLIAWVDCNGPYLGDEEIREMYDPISRTIDMIPPIRPRVATAPVINRFNLRQDGNTSVAVLGDLKLMPDRVPNFDPNRAVRELRFRETLREFEKEKDLKIEIVAASYGADVESERIDVLDRVKQSFNGTRFIPIDRYNDVFGDPKQNVVKNLRIAYKIDDGPVRMVQFKEDDRIILPR